jgi:hypothetical protein
MAAEWQKGVALFDRRNAVDSSLAAPRKAAMPFCSRDTAVVTSRGSGFSTGGAYVNDTA